MSRPPFLLPVNFKIPLMHQLSQWHLKSLADKQQGVIVRKCPCFCNELLDKGVIHGFLFSIHTSALASLAKSFHFILDDFLQLSPFRVVTHGLFSWHCRHGVLCRICGGHEGPLHSLGFVPDFRAHMRQQFALQPPRQVSVKRCSWTGRGDGGRRLHYDFLPQLSGSAVERSSWISLRSSLLFTGKRCQQEAPNMLAKSSGCLSSCQESGKCYRIQSVKAKSDEGLPPENPAAARSLAFFLRLALLRSRPA